MIINRVYSLRSLAPYFSRHNSLKVFFFSLSQEFHTFNWDLHCSCKEQIETTAVMACPTDVVQHILSNQHHLTTKLENYVSQILIF